VPDFIFEEGKHAFMVDGIRWPSVTQILTLTGFVDPTWFTEESALRGTYVHQIVHWHDTGELEESSVDPALMGYLEAWKKFVKDVDFVTHSLEQPRINLAYKFGGVIDRTGLIYGRPAVLDFKSGASPPWTKLQTAGYQILADMPAAQRFALQLNEDGKYNLLPHKDFNDRNVFLSALACVWWQRNNNIIK
jgi:hypothetical protein